MKNITKIVVIVGIMLFVNISYAQRSNWTLGFNVGYKIQMLEKTVPSDLNIKSLSADMKYSFNPPIGINLTYNINERFSISNGFSYLNYGATWKMEEKEEWIGFVGGTIWLKYLQIPLNVKYAIPLGNSNFSVYGKLGLSFDILVDYFLGAASHENDWIVSHYEKGSERVPDGWIVYYEGYYEHNYRQTPEIYDKKLNVLLNAGIGFGYRFKNGLGLSLEGEYYAGLRTMGHVYIKATPVQNFPSTLKEHSEHLLIKGNYLNFGLGISYTFKKKDK